MPQKPKTPKLHSIGGDNKYTPEQRRIVDARLKKSLKEVKKGHTAGPFNTADEMIISLKQELKSARPKNQGPFSLKADHKP